MEDVLIGVLAILVGGLLAFRGWLMLRTLIPLWGAFAGFFLGAGLVASFTGDGFLATLLGWVVGLLVAFVFGLLAYLYYEVSVVLAMSALGFSIATAVLVALGVSWTWVIILVGVAAGLLLAFVAIVANLPMMLLIIISATGGASIATAGAMLVFGAIDVADFTSGSTTERLGDWWWYAVYGAVVLFGIISQTRSVERVSTTLRDSWRDAGGRELATSSIREA